MQANIDNRKELRRLIQEIWSDPEALKRLQKELEALASYKMPGSKKQLTASAEQTSP